MSEPAADRPLGPDGFPVSTLNPLPATPALAAPIETAPVPAPPAEPASEPPPRPRSRARFVGTEHSKTIVLDHPVELDGRVYDKVVVRRMTVGDFQTYFDTPAETRGRLPAFVDEVGNAIPDEILDALDFDDSANVMVALDGFIPRALRADTAPGQMSVPVTGAGSPRP